MLRLIGAVVAGYLLMAVAVSGGLSALWLLLGEDRAFRPDVYEVSATWIAFSMVVGFVAALAGGWVARKIERTARGPVVLAAVVFTLGILFALPALGAEAPEAVARTAGTPMLDAMRTARTPVWVMLLNPIVGAIGVLLGGGVHGGTDQPAATVRT